MSEGEGALGSLFNTGMNVGMPHMVKIPLEVGTNRKFWEGKELVPWYLKNKPPEEQAYEWTPEVYKWLGEKWGVSPLQIERVVKGYGGSATEQVIGAKDPIYQITKRFSGASGGRLDELKEEKKRSGSTTTKRKIRFRKI